MKRRDFLRIAALVPIGVSLNGLAVQGAAISPKFHEALYYRKSSSSAKAVECVLCPRQCTLPDGETGFCRARRNIGGRLYSLGYGSPCSVHIDPIEKKPFFNVLPRTFSFSLASAGCNLRCKFCQNWQISQVSPLETNNLSMSPDDVVNAAVQKGCKSIAYTYTEPSNFYEYMFDIAKIARRRGIVNVSHSNGYINQGPLKELCKYMDAVNIDLKGFSQSFYATMSEGELEPVLATIKTLKRSGVWVEITNLVLQGYNDDEKMMTAMCKWLVKEVGPDTPIHFSRFYPMYKLTGVPPTPLKSLERGRDIAVASGLKFAYIGNIPGHPGENTYCPKCGKMLVQRSGYNILENFVKDGKCPQCGERIGGIWSR
jgi:pyruvate formate lyase activating enzyme